jgi:hypothetical protein
MVAWIGFSQCAVEYKRDARYAGETNYTLLKMIRLAFDGITSFSDRPLKVALQFGVFVTALSFAFGLWIIGASIADPASGSRGWPSLMAVALFLGGIQLLSIGVLGEYLGRVYREVKGRPLYVTEELIGSSQEDAR